MSRALQISALLVVFLITISFFELYRRHSHKEWENGQYKSILANKNSGHREATALNANALLEDKINQKYQENLKLLQPFLDALSPEDREEQKKILKEAAVLFVTNPLEYENKIKDTLTSLKTRRPPKKWVPEGIIADWIKETNDPSPKHYSIAAYLSANPEYFDMGLRNFPDNADILLASLLYEERFLKSPRDLEKLFLLDNNSSWPAILASIVGLRSDNPHMAAEYLKLALGSEVTPYEQDYQNIWDSVSDDLRKRVSHLNAELPNEVGDLFDKRSYELYGDIIHSASDFYTRHQGNKSALEFAIGALALAERNSESSSLVSERVGLMNQLDILNALGVKSAQPFLSQPFNELVESLYVRREHLQKQIEEVKNFSQQLNPEDKEILNRNAAVMGEWAAYTKMVEERKINFNK